MHKLTYSDNLPPASDRECSERSGHPLELIAFFRRFRPGVVRDLIYTFIWDTGFVVVFTVLFMLFDPQEDFARVLWINFVIANCIGYLIHGGFALGNKLLAPWIWRKGFAARSAYFAGISIAGVFGGYWLGFTLLHQRLHARGRSVDPHLA